MREEKGFTLIELAMVILIIGILAAIAIPRFYNLSVQARNAAELGMVGNVRAAVLTYHANAISTGATPVWPAYLDGGAVGQCTNLKPCFETVMETGHGARSGSDWYKASSTTYTGTAGTLYTYNPSTGQFT